MNVKKIVIPIVLVSVLTALLVLVAGTLLAFFILTGIDRANESVRYCAFSNDEFETVDKTLELSLVEQYRSEYDVYNSHVYYDLLSEPEQTVYHVYEYALDNGYVDMCIDSRLIDECERSALQILIYFSLDSPLVEQSIYYRYGDSELLVGNLNKIRVPVFRIGVPSMSSEMLDLKKQAIEKADEIISGIPADCVGFERIRYIFDYLVDNIDYTDYSGSESKYESYLYDALCAGSTDCDGYANAFALLAGKCGFECFEKCYLPDDSTKPGHTWNTVKIDGTWYNADATYTLSSGERLSPLGTDSKVTVYFFQLGFSDDRQRYAPRYADELPPCESSIYEPDLELDGGDGRRIVREVSRALTEDSQSPVILLTDSEIDEDAIREIAGNAGGLTYNYTVHNGQYVYSFKLGR